MSPALTAADLELWALELWARVIDKQHHELSGSPYNGAAMPDFDLHDAFPTPEGSSKAGIHLRPKLGGCSGSGAGLVAMSLPSAEHTLMGTLGTLFMGQGLRRDLHAIDTGWLPEANAEERPSWYALRRMARLLTGASGVSVLSPRAFSSHRDVQEAEPLPDQDKVWGVEFADVPSLGGAQRVYLVFVDPFGTIPVSPSLTGDEDDAPLCARITFSLARRAAFLSQASTAPLTAARVPRSGGLPRTLWTDPPLGLLPVTTTGTSARAQVIVRRWDWPQLVYSSTALSVEDVEVA